MAADSAVARQNTRTPPPLVAGVATSGYFDCVSILTQSAWFMDWRTISRRIIWGLTFTSFQRDSRLVQKPFQRLKKKDEIVKLVKSIVTLDRSINQLGPFFVVPPLYPPLTTDGKVRLITIRFYEFVPLLFFCFVLQINSKGEKLITHDMYK